MFSRVIGFNQWAVYSKVHNQRLGAKELFRLEKALIFNTAAGEQITVPAGFLSDLGSIPRLLWVFIPRDSYPSAYFLHDFLCEKKDRPRLQIDLILAEALLMNGATIPIKNIVYWGVRLHAVLFGVK